MRPHAVLISDVFDVPRGHWLTDLNEVCVYCIP